MKIGSVALVAALTAAAVCTKNVDAFVVRRGSSPFNENHHHNHHHHNHVPLAATAATTPTTTLQMSRQAFDNVNDGDEEMIRSAYVQWCQEHGKTPSEERFAIFAQNYQAERNLLLDQSQSNQIIVLNEFADWTAEEYEQRELSMETQIQTIYQNWCLEYGKADNKYATFRTNFLQNMKHYEDTGDFYRLNEYADMTKDEYDAMVMKMMMPPPSSHSDSDVEAEDDGSGLPSFMLGMVQPAGAGMPSYVNSLGGGNSDLSKPKPASYMPTSYKDFSARSGIPSYVVHSMPTNSGGSGGDTSSPLTPAGPPDQPATATAASSWQPTQPTTYPAPPTPVSPSSFASGGGGGLPSGAGMMSFTDSLSGSGGVGGGAPKPANYMPNKASYKQSSSGLPSYFSNLPSSYESPSYSSPPAPAASSAGPAYQPPPPAYQAPPPASSSFESGGGGPPSGAGMMSFTDSLSGSGGGAPKTANYMPNKASYKQSSSGLPSYFSNLPSSNESPSYSSPPAPAASSAAPAYQPPPPASSSFESGGGGPPSGAGMMSFTDSLSGSGFGGSAPKPANYMPNKSAYKQSSSGLPSYFSNLPSSYESPSYSSPPAPSAPAAPAYQPPPPAYQPPPPASSSFESGGGGPPSGAGMMSFTDSLSGSGFGGSAPKPANYMPNKASYKQSSSGLPSYFSNLPSSYESPSYSSPPAPAAPAAPAYQPPPPASSSFESGGGGPPSGAGMMSFTDSLSGSGGGSGTPKPANYMPNKASYKQSSSGLPSYFSNLPSSNETPSYFSPPAPPPQQPYQPPPQQPYQPPPQQSQMQTPTPSSNGAGLASFVVPSDQAAEFRHIHVPARSGPAQPLARQMRNPEVQPSDQSAELKRQPNPARTFSEFPLAHKLSNPQLLRSDQYMIMREGEAFLPHAQDPVVRRGNILPDQAVGFFFSGRLPSSNGASRNGAFRFPSDQEKADVYIRRSLMYFQEGPDVGRSPPQNAQKPKQKRLGGMKKSSYMPTSYKPTQGTGLPSYFDNF